ncbi:G-protein coupled receptor 1 [Esox lucius]|uniref:G-protein coupled receptors family 1 profile domain-containing protein n=1 Tax=Esox lucius TaxID=8010 RepID=A0A3P8Y851_ESOLU|nr:G-protein coupled receptor 1 [Esox lucius]
MVDFLSTVEYDYNDSVEIPSQSPVLYKTYQMRTGIRFMYVAVYSATICLGLLLNSAVIFMTVKCRSNEKLSQSTLIMGLAVTHLVLCLFTPIYLITAWNYFSWTFGNVVCKLGSYVISMNMFSASLMITFWNVCCYVPVCCDHHMSTNMVLLSWIAGAILSTPSLLSREVQYTADGCACLDKYDYIEHLQIFKGGKDRMMAVVFSRFIFGLLLPLGVTWLSCCCTNNRRSYQVNSLIRPVTVAHFLCWAPVICLTVLQVGSNRVWFIYALPPANALSVLNSCICPVISICKGKMELNSLAQDPHIEENREEDEEMSSLA